MKDPGLPSEPNARRAEASVLLGRMRSGDDDAAEELLDLVYDELRRIAASRFLAQPQGHTLQPTALVHEAFMKLANVPASDWQSINHFKAVAARAMRQILTDHARAKASAKRSGDPEPAGVEGIDTPSGTKTLDLVALERALTKLGELDPRQFRIIELWFFAGLTMGEVAEVIEVSERTVRREWRSARAWLNHQLSLDSP